MWEEKKKQSSIEADATHPISEMTQTLAKRGMLSESCPEMLPLLLNPMQFCALHPPAKQVSCAVDEQATASILPNLVCDRVEHWVD